MAVTAPETPPLRPIIDTEYDIIAVAHLSRVMDLALLQVVRDAGVTPGDIEALAHLSGLIGPAAHRLLGDFEALNTAGIFAPLWGPGQEAQP